MVELIDIKGKTIVVVYNKETNECTNIYEMSVLSEGTEEIGEIIFPSTSDEHDHFILENCQSNSLAPQDNYVDPKTKSIYLKGGFDVTFSNNNPVIGEVVTATVSLVDWQGKDISKNNPCLVKIKDTKKFVALNTPTIDFPKVKTFLIKSMSACDCVIRVKDSNFKFVPSFKELKFSNPPF